MHVSSRKRIQVAAGSVGLLVAALLLAALLFPVSWLEAMAERRLAEAFGRPVAIAQLERERAFTLAPVLRVRGIAIAQAPWAGPGNLAQIDALRVRVPLLPLLIGRGQPEVIGATGVRLDLVRAADGRKSWSKPGDVPAADGAEGTDFAFRGVADGTLRYRDAMQKRAVVASFRIDPKRGLTLGGHGRVDSAPVTISAHGGPLLPGKPWPFAAAIEGAALTMRVQGRMAEPLDTRHMDFAVTARADDLKLIDYVIEAGLFGTQPVRLAANVTRDGARWRVERLHGAIGTSDIAGRLTVDKVAGRTKLDGEVRSRRLDFEDLASDTGQAQGVALERAEGLKLVPNIRVNIVKIDTTDMRIAFRADRIVSRRRASSLTDASGVVTIDHHLLIADPLRIGLRKGAIVGRVTVDQRGRRVPVVRLALDLQNSSIDALAGGEGADLDARLDGRVRLAGVGSTIREAVGRSSGTIGVVARQGSLPAQLASLIGFDVGRALTTDKEERAALRCAVLGLDVRGGLGRIDPLLIDTSRSQTKGVGTIRFPQEALAVTLTGAPKRESLLRLPGSVIAAGTIRAPKITIPAEVKSFGNVLKGIGRALGGTQRPTAEDADCAALQGRLLGP